MVVCAFSIINFPQIISYQVGLQARPRQFVVGIIELPYECEIQVTDNLLLWLDSLEIKPIMIPIVEISRGSDSDKPEIYLWGPYIKLEKKKKNYVYILLHFFLMVNWVHSTKKELQDTIKKQMETLGIVKSITSMLHIKSRTVMYMQFIYKW